jgi:class 3 adenylate cyclase
MKNYHTANLIRTMSLWRSGRIFKCAIKGDLRRYSKVMQDPVVGQQFSTYLKAAVVKIENEVEYSALEGGDAVVLVDDSADRVLAAARSLQRAVNRFQISQSFRFGAAVGPMGYETNERAQTEERKIPSVALVVRAAARIEPYAMPGTVLCTEDFLSQVDPIVRGSFRAFANNGTNGDDIRFEEDGNVVIKKSADDEPIRTRLHEVDL